LLVAVEAVAVVDLIADLKDQEALVVAVALVAVKAVMVLLQAVMVAVLEDR
jgi:hypothetical protein